MARHFITERNAVRPGVIRSVCTCGEVFELPAKVVDAAVMAHFGPPCGCPAFDERMGWHTQEDHDGDCGSVIEPCGGCWGCQAMQTSYYERLAANAERRPRG